MAFTRSTPTNADEKSFPCSSTQDSHDDGGNEDSYDFSADRSLQAASDAASASSLSPSGSSPQASSAQQPMQDLVHLQCWGAGFAGGFGFVHTYVHARVCVPTCGKQLLNRIVSIDSSTVPVDSPGCTCCTVSALTISHTSVPQ